MAKKNNHLERTVPSRRQTKEVSAKHIGELSIRYGQTRAVLMAAKKDSSRGKEAGRPLKKLVHPSPLVPLRQPDQVALDEIELTLPQNQEEAGNSPQASQKSQPYQPKQPDHHPSRVTKRAQKSSSLRSASRAQETKQGSLEPLGEAEPSPASQVKDQPQAPLPSPTRSQNQGRTAPTTKPAEPQEVKIESRTDQEILSQPPVGRHRRRLLHAAKQTAHQQATSTLNTILQEDDTLADIATTRQRFTRAQVTVGKTKQAARLLGTGSQFVVTRSYNVGNRFYNLARGQGFTKTPEEFSWHGQARAKFQAWKSRIKRSDKAKAAREAKRVASWVVKPALAVLKNPLSFKAYVIMFLTALVLAIFGSSGAVAIQDEYDLNQTWIYLTKKDREQSTAKVDYWTNWEDPLLYINHRYDDIRDLTNISEDRLMVDQLLGKTYLNTLWDDLNKDEDKLKTMADLYTQEDSHYTLDEDELEEYNDLLENAKEMGKFSAIQELGNPFYPSDSEQYETPIKITKRFGYVTEDELDTTTTLHTASGQDLYAVMAGTVEVVGNDVIISDQEARFTYKDITGILVRTGDKVTEETPLGKSPGTSLVISYEKQLATSEGNLEWTFVNPGFYFHHVEYTQGTSVVRKVTMAGDKVERIRRFAELIKQLIPEATDEGIASVLGGFDVESGVTFKRYEADYLTDNQFDKMGQEPTVESLLGSWAAFRDLYNIPLNEAGYLVNGKHYLGVGVGMWTGGRTLALWEFAQANGLDMWSEEAQVRFLLEGDRPYYTKIFRDAVTSTSDTDTTTQFFLDNWLGVPGNKLLERQNSAKQILNLLKRPGLSGDYSHIFNVPYKVLQPYGPTPWTLGAGAWLYPKGRHDGIDLVPVSGDFGATDVPVFSATNGKVHTKYGTEIGGYAIIIETDFGGYLYYGHLKYLPDVEIGAEVKKGDPIAVLGNTGAYGIYHVHLAYNETSPNPTATDDRDPSFLILEEGSVTQGQIITP